ncbi:hypothetical protein LshimejAT787_1602130 [Lyophyllum shimeji]|uniref:Uncharacterized protein n=1 Tax=Lyophyllum shimeji TaxID=47721 RepID=A0A9P3PZ97_LYOSH|nr:hypothetical protein LshimejAT787_1602130 [Lyophyllum shimeji]
MIVLVITSGIAVRVQTCAVQARGFTRFEKGRVARSVHTSRSCTPRSTSSTILVHEMSCVSGCLSTFSSP